jgi:hypothetical protein
MGGFAGHMMHLNDNPNLTFGQLKDVFNKASRGELVGTEKTDGQNLFVSYSVRHKEARAVRNKGEAAKGGLDPTALASKFADRGDLTKTFVESFRAFELAVQSLPIETQLNLFGPDANNFYNAEIMNPSSANVINYDTKSLVIHRVGHIQRDKETGEIRSLEDNELVGELEAALEGIQDEQVEDEYKVQVNAIRNLESLSSDDALAVANGRLEEFMSSNSLTDSNTIGDYIVRTMRRTIDDLLPSLDEDTKDMLIKRILGQTGAPSITQIRAQIPEGDTVAFSKVQEMVDRNKFFFKEIMYPIEDIVHDFAVEMLRGLESKYLLDNKSEVKRLKDEVALAKSVIEDSGSEEAMEILSRQMNKLKDLKNVSTATEGFVFDYDGNTYKFTGTFAPINQILGLFKYGRGNVPPLQKLNEKEDFDGFDDEDIELTDDGDMMMDEERKKIYVYPGRFQPMGKHHADTYKKIAETYGEDNTYVATSNKVDPPRSPFSFSEKLEIIAAHGIPAEKIVQVKNPYNAIEILQDYDTNEVEIVYFVGKKDMDEDPRFAKTSGVTKDGYKWRIVVAPHISREIEGFGEMSGTTLRQALKHADEEEFTKIMGFESEPIHQLVLSVLNDSEEDQDLEEISAMSSGAAQGYSGDNKKPTLIRQEGLIMREELIIEMKLRELIQNKIKKKISENKKSGIIYLHENQIELIEQYRVENALRKCIRKMILTEKTDPVPHSNTGINQLDDLLKKIVPTLRRGYKSLTTSEEQRISYRSHILNAVINSLAIERAEDDIVPEPLSEDEDIGITLEDPEDTVDPRDHEKFIDVDPPEEEEAFETLPGQDLTGRNKSVLDFDRIEKDIQDAYAVLGDEKDQDLFYDYLLTNLKLHFDSFEKQLKNTPEEPSTPEYEEEKENAESDLMQEKRKKGSVKELHETAPPGFSEEKMMALKKEYPGDPERAFATAWTIHNKSK